MERAVAVRDILADRKVVLTAGWPGDTSTPRRPIDREGDPFTIYLPTLLLVNKSDQVDDPKAEIAVFEDLTDLHFPTFPISATTGAGLDQLGPWLFARLGIVRIYTKAPGKPPDLDRPYTIQRGDVVQDLATLVHRELAGLHVVHLGSDEVGGQEVGRELDPGKVCLDGLSHGLDQQRLGQTRDTLEQDVTIGQERDEDPLHHVFLAHHDGVDLCQKVMQKERFLLYLRVELPNVCYVHLGFLLSLFRSERSIGLGTG